MNPNERKKQKHKASQKCKSHHDSLDLLVLVDEQK
jgi:hypothetical protein